jgi:hypothetical protein
MFCLCEHCWEKPAKHRIRVLRTKHVGLCGNCHTEATNFEVLSPEAIAGLPDDQDARGVYFLFDGDQLQYIGQSMCIGNRVTQHEQAYNFGIFRSVPTKQIKFDKVRSLVIDRRPFASQAEIAKLRNRMLIVERAYIERYRPPFNTEWFL